MWIFSSVLQLWFKDFLSVYPDYCWRVWLGSEQRDHLKRTGDWPEIRCFIHRLANSSCFTTSSEKSKHLIWDFSIFFPFFGGLVTFLFDWELIFGLWTFFFSTKKESQYFQVFKVTGGIKSICWRSVCMKSFSFNYKKWIFLWRFIAWDFSTVEAYFCEFRTLYRLFMELG